MIVAPVGRGDAGSCRHGCTEDRRGVVALVAIGDGTDGEPAQGSRSSSREGEVHHGGGGRTRRCAVAIVMVIVIIGSGGARSDTRTGAALGEVGMRLGRGSAFAEGGHSTATIRGRLAGRQPGRRAEAGDHDRRSVPIAMIVTSVGLGDGEPYAEPFRRGGTEDRRGVVALVAIGDGAEAERSHGTCRPSGEGVARGGDRTRRCAVAVDIITATSGNARGRGAGRCSAQRRG